MKKITLLLCFLFTLGSFNALAGKYVFTGDSYRSYKVDKKGNAIGQAFYSYVNFRIVVDTDCDFVSVQVNHDKLYKFKIINKTASTDTFKGIYFYCTDNILLNLFTDHDNHRRIMLKTPKAVSFFEI